MKSNLLTVQTSCNNCGSTASTFVSSGTDYEYDTTDDIFTFVRCTDCGLVYLNPRPDISELEVLYPPEYIVYNVQTLYDERQRRSLYYKIRHGLFVSKLQSHLEEFFPTTRKLVMLDIGCADGHTLNLFKSVKDFELETHGIDMCAQSVAVAKASGHTTYIGRFEEVEMPRGHFDLIYSSHVIEHVPDPKEFARKARTLLKPGGILWLWTPNIGSVDARLFKNKYWGPYCFPRHFFVYDDKSIRRLAAESNFEVLKIAYAASWIGWVQTFHNLCKDNKYLHKFADRFFLIRDMIKTTPAYFLRNSCLTFIDLILLATTGQAGTNMEAVLKKCDNEVAQGRQIQI